VVAHGRRPGRQTGEQPPPPLGRSPSPDTRTTGTRCPGRRDGTSSRRGDSGNPRAGRERWGGQRL
jgi:hypothetical protein